MTTPKTRLICPLTTPDRDSLLADIQSALLAGADTIELRLDFMDLPADQLRELVAGLDCDIIVTNRPKREGGNFTGSEDARLASLTEAAGAGATFVDVEMDVPPQQHPQTQVILSHHDFETCPDDLDDWAGQMEASPAAVNKLAFKARGPQDALRTFDIIRSCKKPTLALAMGEAGVASRILARKFGAFGTFASLSAGKESAPGQPTLTDMKQLYRWDALQSDTQLFGVIGCPVGHSMSPAIHNAAFDAASYNGVYVPLRIEPGYDNFAAFMDAVRQRPWLDWKGLSVTIPHKENALEYIGADNCDPLAVQIGAVNTVTFQEDGSLRGDNTDYAGATDALCNRMGISREQLAGKTVAILGAGGASRALVAAMRHYGAEVTVYNRTLPRAEALAQEFGAKAAPMDQANSLQSQIVINCTPIGMHPNIDACPIDEIPSCVEVVFDTIYNPLQTQLIDKAQKAGCLTVSGLDMFVNQAVAQYEIWTRQQAPREVMANVVLEKLSQTCQK